MLTFILTAALTAVIGLVVGYLVGSSREKVNAQEIEARIERESNDRCRILESEARSRATEIIQTAEREADQTHARIDDIIRAAERDAEKLRAHARAEGDALEKSRRAEFDRTEQRLSNRESKLDERAISLDGKQDELRQEERRLRSLEQSVSDRARNLEEREQELSSKLEELAEMTRDQAREKILGELIDDARVEATKRARRLEEEIIAEADKRAKKVIAVTIQRYAGEYVSERCVTVINLPSDDMKGRIIGREGRNIRAIEAATGCDLIIDDTPEAIVVSGFDPTRREVARQSIERLIADGRIHPARIEEVVSRTQSEMEKTLREAGEQAAFELGLTDLHPEILHTIGRLKYRTSYGQNMWAHSIEVGFLCGLMAAELGLNVKLARRAGLLHDIGKAIDHEQEGSHAIIGANLIKKHGEHDIIVNAVAAHHEEVPAESIIAHLVMAADALSGARPGARREILESYVQRIQDLENIATSFDGVSHAYAIQAGREVRVIVEHGRVNDEQATLLSQDIARRIENELTYPGQIRVTVIREVRAAEIAR